MSDNAPAHSEPSPWAIAERRPPSGWVITRASIQRFCLTVGLCLFGVYFLLWGTVTGVSLVVVPWFSLENVRWNRPDNPATWPNVGLGLLAGGVCLYAARSSDRTRRRIAVAGVVLSFVGQGIEWMNS